MSGVLQSLTHLHMQALCFTAILSALAYFVVLFVLVLKQEAFQQHFNPKPSTPAINSLWRTGFLVTATLGLGALMAVTCKT